MLVYDGECPLCTGLTEVYVRLGWLPRAQRVALQDLDGELVERLLALGFGNEMAVVEPDRITIRTGVAGLFRLLRDTWARPLVVVLDRPILRPLCEVLYRFVGANRRFLSLPRPRGPACACDPDERPAYNLALVAIAGALAFLFALTFWRAFARELGTAGRGGVGGVVSLSLTLLLVAWLAIPLRLRLRALGHLAMSLFFGSLALLPGALLVGNAPEAWAEALAWLTALILLLVCASQLSRRLRYLGLATVRVRAWSMALFASALLLARPAAHYLWPQ